MLRNLNCKTHIQTLDITIFIVFLKVLWLQFLVNLSLKGKTSAGIKSMKTKFIILSHKKWIINRYINSLETMANM